MKALSLTASAVFVAGYVALLAAPAGGQYRTYTYPQYQTYGGYYYTPYNPPKVTYLLIVPAPEPKKTDPVPAPPPAPKVPPPVEKKFDPPAAKTDDPPAEKKFDPVPPEPLKAPPAAEDKTPAALAPALIAVLEKNCVACHGPEKAKGGLTLLTGEPGGRKIVPLTANQWWEVYGRANAGQMPPAAAKDATKAVAEADLIPLLKRALVK